MNNAVVRADLSGGCAAVQIARSSREESRIRIPLPIQEHAGLSRKREPVVVGVPLPQGLVAGEFAAWIGHPRPDVFLPCQVAPLAWWLDGSVKWLSATLLIDIEANEHVDLELCISASTGVSDRDGAAHDVSIGNGNVLSERGIHFECRNAHGRARNVSIDSMVVEATGPIRRDWRFNGRVRRCGGLRIDGKVSVFESSGLMRIEATLQNPGRAKHAGGFWDLGDAGSVLLNGWRMVVDLSDLSPQSVEWLETDFTDLHRAHTFPWRICQYSSGGENWNSRNHINRHNSVPLRMRGYRMSAANGQREGMRASPVLCCRGASGVVTCALAEFWEKFPSAIAGDGRHLSVEFWPDDFGDLYELQAGEHCTRVVWLRFDAAADGAPQNLAWVHEPLVAQIDPDWLAASNAIPWLPDSNSPRRPESEMLLGEALTGPRNMFAKREVIDEFGWRNFGDVWADHEEAYYDGDKPIISHYNNQYDLLYGLLIQFLLTGDWRWWRLADPLARHVMDIDIYHTSRDKAAYSGGLFWHTAHYLDAATSSHRTYSKQMKGPSGGPANEHAYSAGLLLYFYLTGDRRAKDTVVRLADWIVAMDDGSQHLFGLLSDAPTGRASCTTDPDYHGPGRGAGNAIGVLLDAWLASADPRYVDFAEDLICRTIHPQDDIPSLDLNNFEHRWSYTVYLQLLARYLLLTDSVDRPNSIRAYAAASLSHYGDWMVDNDLFYLDYPERLEYPTETWAAQALRKGNVLYAASQFVDAAHRERFRRRGEEMMDRAWKSLMSFNSRCCTRPLALVLQQSYIETSLNTTAGDARKPLSDSSWLPGPTFVSQKQRIQEILASPSAAVFAAFRLLRPKLWRSVWKRSWLAQRVRHTIARA